MKVTTHIGAIALFAVATLATAAQAETREYMRKGDQLIRVTIDGDKLNCTRVSDGFEMCHGMTKQSDGSYKGRKMKHPDMPGFMTFNGTVTFGSNGMKIRGCAVGVCQSEVWTNK